MSKKDYEAAARIVQHWASCTAKVRCDDGPVLREKDHAAAIQEAFVELFHGDNPRFDEARFRRACVPGANVRSRRAA